ncbi:MAG: hypothetical protein IPG02_14455 [Ignavibacteria bacterium]|nr:hypothetical protein [Ignavibacteria bacterium]MBK6876766.1 hypothetical protein [Ignavibacteria bacterium]MBK9229058.1 hypothetical protein [Ignavibacteria bacterium]
MKRSLIMYENYSIGGTTKFHIGNVYMKMKFKRFISLFLFCSLGAISALAQVEQKPAANDAAEIAKKLANPIGAMISVPFQNNMDVGIGEFNGSRNTMNFQPIVPFELSEKFNLITRYILPVITQHDITNENTQQSGLADALVSAWISNAKVKNGLVWGLGGAFLIPTATNDMLGSKKFGAGPTAILLKQANGWTYGALVNQVWSVAGSEEGTNVNQIFTQPFVTYNWKSGTGLTVNTELTHYWESSETNAFINIMAGGILKFGKQLIQAQVGPRIQVAATEGNRADFGVRTALIFVFPK